MPRRAFATLLLAALALAAGEPRASGAQPLAVRAVELSPTEYDHQPLAPFLPLTTDSGLYLSQGPWEELGFSFRGSVTLLVENLAREPQVTSIPTPIGGLLPIYAWENVVGLIRLSATRALLSHTGADQEFATEDDGVYLLDDLGGENRVTSIPLGRTTRPRMARLDHETALAVVQEDSEHGSLVLLSELGSANRATRLRRLTEIGNPLGWLPQGLPSAPIVLSSKRFVAGLEEGGLAVVELRGTSVASVQPIETDELPSQILTLSPRRLLFWAPGIFYVVEIGETVRATPIPTPSWGRAIKLSPRRAIAVGGEDELVLLDDLGGKNRVVRIPVPDVASWGLVALGSDVAAVPMGGAPGPATGLAVVRNLGGSPSIVRVPFGTQDFGGAVWLPPSTLLTVTPGDTPGHYDLEDETLTVVRPLDDPPTVESLTIPYAFSSPGFGINLLAGPQPLGNGRVVIFDNHDHVAALEPHGLQVIEGFADDVQLHVRKVEIQTVRGRGIRARAVAEFSLPHPARFGSQDLEVRLGVFHQTLPARDIVRTERGFSYDDPGGRAGFFRHIEYDVARRRLAISGRGRGDAPGALRADNLALSLQSSDLYVAQTLDAEERGGRVLYSAP
jgi:hypothetical protein